MAFAYAKELTTDAVMTHQAVMREGTYIEITTAVRVFHIDGAGTIPGTYFISYMVNAGQIDNIPKLNSESVVFGKGSVPLMAKKYDIVVRDSSVATVIVTYDDDPYTSPNQPGLVPINEWRYTTRMAQRQTYVDVNGIPIYTNYQNVASDEFLAETKKSTALPQSYPQMEMTLTQYCISAAVLERYSPYVGKINSDIFMGFNIGMVRCDGFDASPVLNEKIEGFPRRTPRVHMVNVHFLTAGPEKIVTSIMGNGPKKYGWDGLAYCTDPKTNDIIRNKTAEIKTTYNFAGSEGAPEVIVRLYELADFKELTR